MASGMEMVTGNDRILRILGMVTVDSVDFGLKFLPSGYD
jgi:hypothetical protein